METARRSVVGLEAKRYSSFNLYVMVPTWFWEVEQGECPAGVERLGERPRSSRASVWECVDGPSCCGKEARTTRRAKNKAVGAVVAEAVTASSLAELAAFFFSRLDRRDSTKDSQKAVVGYNSQQHSSVKGLPRSCRARVQTV